MKWGWLLLLASCTADWPAASRGDELGPEVGDKGPTHRPGQPCLWCHGGEAATAPEWVAAGTVYAHEGDGAGVAGAQVTLTDADGKELVVTTNSVGNFFVSEGRGGREGELGVARAPRFPLHAKVTLNGMTREMRGVIQRDGGCATCHREPPGAALVGKVWVLP